MSSSPFQASDSGLLLVFMEPGRSVSLEEFHEWYDTEHVPLRIHRFPTFRSATRYAVTSTALHPASGTAEVPVAPKSTWGAFYTISSNAVFGEEAYTSLRSQRSEREAELFTRLAIVDRRIYRLEYDSDSDANIRVERKKIGLDVQREADTPAYLVTNSVDVVPEMVEEYNRWFQEEHVPMLANVKGWRRSRRFTLIDNGVNGRDAKQGDAEGVPRCLGLHEYDQSGIEQTPEYKRACDTPWRTKVIGPDGRNIVRRERKTCELYRAWDPVAALEAEAQK